MALMSPDTTDADMETGAQLFAAATDDLLS
jgi:hypothetical protein